MGEEPREAVDRPDHLVAIRHREGAAGQEVVLHVDDDQQVLRGDANEFGHRHLLRGGRAGHGQGVRSGSRHGKGGRSPGRPDLDVDRRYCGSLSSMPFT
jgi:hypothetical protein